MESLRRLHEAESEMEGHMIVFPASLATDAAKLLGRECRVLEAGPLGVLCRRNEGRAS